MNKVCLLLMSFYGKGVHDQWASAAHNCCDAPWLFMQARAYFSPLSFSSMMDMRLIRSPSSPTCSSDELGLRPPVSHTAPLAGASRRLGQ